MSINPICDAGVESSETYITSMVVLDSEHCGFTCWIIDLIARAVAGREKLDILTWKRQCGLNPSKYDADAMVFTGDCAMIALCP